MRTHTHTHMRAHIRTHTRTNSLIHRPGEAQRFDYTRLSKPDDARGGGEGGEAGAGVDEWHGRGNDVAAHTRGRQAALTEEDIRILQQRQQLQVMICCNYVRTYTTHTRTYPHACMMMSCMMMSSFFTPIQPPNPHIPTNTITTHVQNTHTHTHSHTHIHSCTCTHVHKW